MIDIVETAQSHFLQILAAAMQLYHQAIDLASNPKHTRWLSPLFLLADAALCALVIWKIPCELSIPGTLAPTARFSWPEESGVS